MSAIDSTSDFGNDILSETTIVDTTGLYPFMLDGGVSGNDQTPSPIRKRHKQIFESKLGKYALHGFAFSILMLAIAFGWVIVLAILATIGSFIGLIIGIVALLYVVGLLNTYLNGIIWGEDISDDWKEVLTHGFYLLVALFIVNIPGIAINWLIPSIITNIVIFVIYCFVDGYVARAIAAWA